MCVEQKRNWLSLIRSNDLVWHRPIHNWIRTLPTDILTSPQGSFAALRKNYWHTGVDIYVQVNKATVYAVEHGVVVAIEKFTSRKQNADWMDTDAVLVESAEHVVVYGEVVSSVPVGQRVYRGDVIAQVERVLYSGARRDIRGHSPFMLHLELHKPGTRTTYDWKVGDPRPESLLDPTKLLVEAYERCV